MLCIFCLKEKPPGDEHVFPLAIGGSLPTDRVCKQCNSVLGTSVDAPLCNNVFIVMRRQQLGLRGNSNTLPDELKAFFGTGELVGDSGKRIQVSRNPSTGEPELKMMYHASEKELGEGVRQRQITIDPKDAGQIGTIIQRELKRAGFEPRSSEQLKAEVDKILTAGVQTIEKPQLTKSLI
jgi:hypothetical protein